VWVVDEVGYGAMTVAGILTRSRVSRKTFYEMFESREECFLAVFDVAVEQIAERVQPAWQAQTSWHDRVHGTLGVLLRFFDDEPLLARLCVVHALQAGPAVLQRRAEVLRRLSGAVRQGWHVEGAVQANEGSSAELMAEGVVGAVFMIVHERLLEPEAPPLSDLLGPLTGIVMQAYPGGEVTTQSPAADPPPVAPAAASSRLVGEDLFERLDTRLTNRTLEVLAAIHAHPGSSNREIASRAGNVDQGQMSKLLARLARLGLVHNAAAVQPSGAPNAWSLTAKGLAIERAASADSDLGGTAGRVRGEVPA
jgi:AcrR family transcriptional regulator